jgi:hypothetical protein
MTPLFTANQEMFFVILTLVFIVALIGDFSKARFFRSIGRMPDTRNELDKATKLFMILLVVFMAWAQDKDSLRSSGNGDWLSGETLEAIESEYYYSLMEEESGITWALLTGNPPFTSNAVLTASQFQAGFACASVTDIQPSALAAPANAVTFTNWPYAVARQAVLLPPDCIPQGFTFGGRPVTNLYMAASGILSFDGPKSSPIPATNGIPDGTALNYIAVLQTPSDIVPTNGIFWYATGTNSSVFTWRDVFLGQDTNCLATVQAELYANGDFTCRYSFPSPTYSYSSIPDGVLIGAQNNPGGETVLHTNNLLAVHSAFISAFELRWKSVAGLNPAVADHDDDSLSTADELFIHRTDPRRKDSDGDGLTDPAEIASATDPRNPDTNNDGIPDGIDLTGYSLSDTNLVFKLINNIAPSVDPNLDTDNDGWADWLELRFGTNPNDFYSTPAGMDNLFSVTVTLATPPPETGVLAVGTNRVLVAGSGSWTFWRTPGEAHPVSFTSPHGVPPSFQITLNRPSAARYAIPQPVGKDGSFGKVALPLITFDPEIGRCCHEARTGAACQIYTAVVSPQIPGAYVWDVDGTWFTNAPNEVIAGHDVNWVGLRFTASGASAYREAWAWINYHCAMAGVDTNNPDRVSVNNNDDDADGTLDDADTEITVGDPDLQPLWPLGRFDGTCCQCSEHQPFATAATLATSSQKLALYTDSHKTNAFGGTIHAGESVHVEGLTPSTEPYAEKLIWQWTEGNETKSVTNALTVLSVRLFPDLDTDDDVDATDIAGLASLSSEYGWLMPVSTNVLRKLRLRTDVGLSGGAYTLSLAGEAGAFKVWADNSGTNTAPLLTCGQVITNGVGGVSFLVGDDSDLYVEAAGPGAATIIYAYTGEGGISNLSCSAELKMTAFRPDIDVDSDNDGTIEQHNQGEDRYEEYQPGMLLTVTNALAEGSGIRLPVRLSTDFMGFTGIARLEQVSSGGAVRAWTNTQPGAVSLTLPAEWDLTQNQTPPSNVWVDGVTEGGVTLKYSLVQNSVLVASDKVQITVIPPASYAPGKKDLVCIWAPLKTYDNSNTNNNLGYTDAEKLASELINQGWTNVVWFEDVTGDTDLDLGTCTPENYLAMRDAGVFCVTASHGSPGYHDAVYAPYSEAGRQLIENWCSNRVGMTSERVDPIPGDPNSPGYYYALVSSGWMQTNWKPWLDTNKAITVWSICYSGTAFGQLYSVKEGSGGRWRIGYTAPLNGFDSFYFNETYFRYMNGKQGDGLRRTAGKAWGGGYEYSNYNAKMDGNPWTTLCPAFIQGEPLYPYSLFPNPGSTASPGVGWGCVLTDTYLSDEASPSGTFEQPGASMITDVRWISAGSSGKRGLGFDYDKSSNSNIWLRIVPSKYVSDGLGGGRPLVKRADAWGSSWLDIIF